MKILVVGGGGREHAIVRALARSPRAPELLCAPGNPGIAADARLRAVAADDVDGLLSLVADEAVDLVVVGPEAPLVAGLVDRLREAGVAAFGPTAAAAEIEGSKAFAKAIMIAAGVPTAGSTVVETVEAGMDAIGGRYPVALKFDGLAAGKGVVLPESEGEARAALEAFLVERRFGCGAVVVEDFLVGEELSLLAVCDGRNAYPLAPARDFKRIFDGDLGPNTGGMGAFCPVPGGPDADELVALVHLPVLRELAARGTPFTGVLYAGLMLTADGPKVIEFNARFGDPETQAVLPRLQSDLVELLEAATISGGLGDVAKPVFDEQHAVTLVLASAGYPEGSRSGDAIAGLDAAAACPGVEVTHAGTADGPDGPVVTAGGRVLNVTALGGTLAAARKSAYAAADLITFDGAQRREDIAARAVEQTA